ncbi:hypothetical protein NCAS_0B02030 [Naumovozyma castellii]|uniref:MADS-box domain-containing protein n=1 Tax=Naumovozyma castellii TaxID=27288 RepID=G0VBG1_NAUCA|nr:hypothetical protein NCAS_0B02030 [Naumovozyma castellii CBS 4309]CCC68287.1 hypothetical protein NCAS_0B02030 [Naumovozyma castellii CBS 4309]
MGRRKIEIKPIAEEKNRSVTFAKRKAGLFKKAHELAVLCKVEVALIVLGSNNAYYEYSSMDLDEFLKCYLRNKESEHYVQHPTEYELKRKRSWGDFTEDNKPILTNDPNRDGMISNHSPYNTNAARPLVVNSQEQLRAEGLRTGTVYRYPPGMNVGSVHGTGEVIMTQPFPTPQVVDNLDTQMDSIKRQRLQTTMYSGSPQFQNMPIATGSIRPEELPYFRPAAMNPTNYNIPPNVMGMTFPNALNNQGIAEPPNQQSLMMPAPGAYASAVDPNTVRQDVRPLLKLQLPDIQSQNGYRMFPSPISQIPNTNPPSLTSSRSGPMPGVLSASSSMNSIFPLSTAISNRDNVTNESMKPFDNQQQFPSIRQQKLHITGELPQPTVIGCFEKSKLQNMRFNQPVTIPESPPGDTLVQLPSLPTSATGKQLIIDPPDTTDSSGGPLQSLNENAAKVVRPSIESETSNKDGRPTQHDSSSSNITPSTSRSGADDNDARDEIQIEPSLPRVKANHRPLSK